MGPGYTGIDVGKGGTGGGMQKKPMPEAPTMWLTYVQVDEADRHYCGPFSGHVDDRR